MGIFTTGLKIVGSVALGSVGLASSALRGVANAVGADIIADGIGLIEDKSFNTIQDIWTSEDEKDEAYYEAQAAKSEQRAESAARTGERKRKEYEQMKEKAEKERKN